MADQAGQQTPDGTWRWNGTEWVPNFPTLPNAPGVAWARPYESPRLRFNLVSIFLVAYIAAQLVSVLADVLLLALLAQEETITDNQVFVADFLARVAAILYVATFASAVVFFSMWLHRVVRNMPALGSSDPRWSPTGAVVRCFIPIFNWFHPLLGTLDAWRASDPTRRFLDFGARKAIHTPLVFAAWWVLWLIGAFLSNVGSRLTNSDDLGTFTTGEWMSLAGDVLSIGAAGLLILVVHQVTDRQDFKSELIASGQLA